ncbi:MAG: tetratricopeptide repeat protein, partial [Anaerolineales bacterium]
FRFQILDNDPLAVVHQKFEEGIAGFLNGDSPKIAPMIGQLVGFDFSENPMVAPKLEDPEGFHDEALRYLGDFFLTASETHPVLIQVEDIHWADERSLDLLNSLARENTEIPLFIIYMARPELYDRRPSWGEGQLFHDRIMLHPLSRLDSRRLVRELLKKVDKVPTRLRDLIIDRAEGNPYYMEELVKALIDDGVIIKGQDRWTVQVDKLARVRVPATLVGVLQSRLDSFPAGQRALLQRASVIGRIFWESGAAYLSAAEGVTAGAVASMLNDLHRREMVFKREESTFEGTAEYGFRHAILRDVVYETIVPSQRRGYHKQVAEWLVESNRDRLDEYNLLIAEHYERADEKALASEYTARAAQVAGQRGTIDESIEVGLRALALLEGADAPEQCLKLHLQLGQQYGFKGNYPAAIDQFKSALVEARGLGDRSAEAQALGELGRVVGTWQSNYEVGREYLDEAMQIARELDDKPNQMFLLRQLGNLGFGVGDFEQAIEYLKQSLEVARELEDVESQANALNSLGLTTWALEDFEGAREWLLQALELAEQRSDRQQMAMINSNMAFAELELGNLAEGLARAQRSLQLSREVGSDALATSGLSGIANALILQGELEAGRKQMFERLRAEVAMGNEGGQAFAVTEFGRLLALEGDQEKGLEYIGLGRINPQVANFGRRYFGRLIEQARGDLTDEQVEAALKRGEKLELEDVVSELLGEGDRI